MGRGQRGQRGSINADQRLGSAMASTARVVYRVCSIDGFVVFVVWAGNHYAAPTTTSPTSSTICTWASPMGPTTRHLKR